MNGFINIFKPSGITSAYALTKIKKAFKGEKIGHMGTLDPLASGVLPVGIGKCNRLFNYLLDKDKVYKAEFTFGYETDTLDSDGKIIKESKIIPSKEEVLKVLPSLMGEVMQVPPSYSAKNVDGKRSYQLARRGIQVELPPKKVEISKIQLDSVISDNTFAFTIYCKGGTYIRSICRDMAYKLNTFATMTKLSRVQSGCFSLENSIKIEDLDNFDYEKHLIKPEDVINFESITLNEKDDIELNFGRQVLLEKADGLYKIFNKQEFIGIGEIQNKSLKIKAYIKD
jgi:tRNA pseudouridine55 synthase